MHVSKLVWQRQRILRKRSFAKTLRLKIKEKEQSFRPTGNLIRNMGACDKEGYSPPQIINISSGKIIHYVASSFIACSQSVWD